MSFRGPLASRYGAAVALVVLALVPYLVLTTAIEPLTDMIGEDTGLGPTGMSLTAGMANAAYAFGAVAGLQLAVHLPVRRVLVVLSLLFVFGSVLAAWSPVGGFFVAGRVLQGLTTGAMLIAAVPPLVLNFGSEKLPKTAVVMNLGIFGAVALGPVLGGASAGTDTWRPFLWIVAGLGLLGTLMALLTFEDQEPQAPDAPRDYLGLGLLSAGVAALFFGVSYVSGRHLISVPVLIPAGAGLLLLVAGLVYETRAKDPLMPIRQLSHTLPLAGIIIACAAGAASVALVQLATTGLQLAGESPYHAGTLFWPLIGGALLSAACFGALFFTRWTTTFARAGLLALAGGGVLLLGARTGDDARVLVGTFLVGLGTGASVAPALFTAGFSLKSAQLPRVFAMVELLRGVAAFLVGPLLVHLAQTTGGSQATGLRTATWAAVGIAAGGFVVASAVYLLGGARRHPPRIDRWLAQEGPALESPELFARSAGHDVGAVAGLLAVAGAAVVLGLSGLGVVPVTPAVAVTLIGCGLLAAFAAVPFGAWVILGTLLLALTDRQPVVAVVALVAGGALLGGGRRSLVGVRVLGAGWFVLYGLRGLLGEPGLDTAAAVTAFALAAAALATAGLLARRRPAPDRLARSENGRFEQVSVPLERAAT